MGNSKLGLLTSMLAMSIISDETYGQPPTTKRKEITEKVKIKRMAAKGVYQYFYGVNYVFARNQKNADKKARKKGYIE